MKHMLCEKVFTSCKFVCFRVLLDAGNNNKKKKFNGFLNKPCDAPTIY